MEPMGVPENCCQPHLCSAWSQLQFRPHQGEGGRSWSPLTVFPGPCLSTQQAERERAQGQGLSVLRSPGCTGRPHFPAVSPPATHRPRWASEYSGAKGQLIQAGPQLLPQPLLVVSKERVGPVPEFSCKGGVGGSDCVTASGWGE